MMSEQIQKKILMPLLRLVDGKRTYSPEIYRIALITKISLFYSWQLSKKGSCFMVKKDTLK